VIVVESRRGRRVVGRLEKGADLAAALLDVCRARGVRSGAIEITGALEDAELREFDQRDRAWRPTRRFATPFTILHLRATVAEQEGRLHLDATCVLSRERDNGIEVIGGHLVRARVFAVEFVVESWDDLVVRRSIDPATGLPLLGEAVEIPDELAAPRAAVAHVASQQDGFAATQHAPPLDFARDRPAPAAPLPFEAPARGQIVSGTSSSRGAAVAEAPTWLEVAAASERQPPPPPDLDDEAPPEAPLREGDVIEHPRFGRCDVERIEGDAEYAQVRLRNHRLVRLSLDVLQLVRDGVDEGGLRRWRVEVSR
jgi:predicted DNA-binding protein with PD1-like motif